jgi:drug/metabolite transporter (DMT)-like permease
MKIIFIIAFLFIYIIAILLLKPMRYHVKRKYSTTTLKFSYLIYLAVFLTFTYLFLFFYKDPMFSYFESTENPSSTIHFIILLLGFFVPNIGILIRRKFKQRTVYNVIFSLVNVVFSLYIWFLIQKATELF